MFQFVTDLERLAVPLQQGGSTSRCRLGPSQGLGRTRTVPHGSPPAPVPTCPSSPAHAGAVPPTKLPLPCGRFLLQLPLSSESCPQPLVPPTPRRMAPPPSCPQDLREEAMSGLRHKTHFCVVCPFPGHTFVRSSVPSQNPRRTRGTRCGPRRCPAPHVCVPPGVRGVGGAGRAGENRKPTPPGESSGVLQFQGAGLSPPHSPLWILRD